MKLPVLIVTVLFLLSQPTQVLGSNARAAGIKVLAVSIGSEISMTKPMITGPGGMQVNSFTGNLLHQRQDVFIPGRGLSIDVTFSYNSGSTKNDWGLGRGWTSTFNMMYERKPGVLIMRGEDGRKDSFAVSGTTYTPPVGVFSDLSEYAPGKMLLRNKHGVQYFFDDSTHKHLTGIQDPNGNTLTFSGFVSNQPSIITDATGRSIGLGWSGGHLAYIRDSIASPIRTTLYQYDTRGNLKRVTDPVGNTYQYRYDAHGRLTGFADELSHTVDVTYNSNGGVTGITTPGSTDTPPTALTFSYNPPARQTTVGELVAGSVQSTTFTFDTQNRAVSMQGCCGLNEQYEYNSQNNVSRMVNSNGNATDNVWDAKGNLLSTTDALGQVSSWTYEPAFNRATSMTDKRGNTTTLSYDSHGNLLSVSRVPLLVSFTCNVYGEVISATDGRGNTSSYSYDGNGRLTGIVRPIGSESFSYDNSGNVTSWTDANGRTTMFSYDALDRRVSMTNALGGTRLYVYGGANNLVQETDENGHSAMYTYDAMNRVIAVALPEGTAIFTRDEYGNVRQCLDFKGNLRSYGYDGRNRLTSITDPLGHSRTLTYDNNGNVLTGTDFNGNPTTWQYDVLDRRTLTTDLLGHDVLVVFDQNNNVVSVTDQNGHVTTCTYDAMNRLVQATYPVGTRSFSYDNNSNLISSTDPNGHVTTYSYDANNRRTTMLDPLLHTTGMAYDPAGNLLSITDPNGLVSTFSYDGLHRMISSANPMSQVTTCTYDAAGNRITCTLPHGNGLSYTYDASNRVTAIADALGPVASYTYDANSNVLTEADGNGNTRQYVYDPLDRVTSALAPLGQNTGYAYDNNSNRIATTDGAGGTTAYTYDGLNRQISTTIPGGLTTAFGYDPAGNLVSILDGRGNTTAFTLDAMDRVTQVSYANGSNRQCTYDPAGNVLSLQDQNSNSITHTYDPMDRLLSRNFPGGSTHAYAYDNSGRMTSAISSGADVTFTYDGAGRIVSEVLNGKTTSRSYNVAGRTVTTTYPGGKIVTASMNPRLFTSSLHTGAAGGADFTYDPASRLASMTGANGGSTSWSYNDNDWITAVSHNRGPVQLAKFDYSFDNRGYRTSVEKLHRPAHSEKYQYDAVTRVTGYQEGTLVGGNIPAPLTQTQFTFDAVGNRTNSTKDLLSTTYVANTINAYTSISGGSVPVSPLYDGNGNMTSDGARAFMYDYMDRLTGVLDVATNAAYTYDALGRRIKKVLNGITTKYFFDGNNVIEERDGSDAIQSEYIRIRDMDANRLDGSISMTRHTGPVTREYYYHRNSLGSVVAMTDDSGNVVEQYEYDSFGNVSIYDSAWAPRSTSAIGNAYMFGGMEYDGESGLFYDRARHYNPQIGRFMQQDPSSVMGDRPDLANGYSYVGNNPVNYIDPDGLEKARPRTEIVKKIWGRSVGGGPNGQGLRISGNGAFGLEIGGVISGNKFEGVTFSGSGSDGLVVPKQNVPVREFVTLLALNVRPYPGATDPPVPDVPMSARETRSELKDKFQDGDIPTGTDFADLIDSFLNFEDDGITSSKVSRPVLKSFFQTGDKPTASQFSNLIDSFLNFEDDGITSSKVSRPVLKSFFQTGDKPTASQFSNLIDSFLNFEDDGITSSKVSRPVLKSFFQTGDKPTAAQFSNFIDSFLNYHDDSGMTGLDVTRPSRLMGLMNERRGIW